MEAQARTLHPLVAGAAAATILAAGVGVAAITGWVPDPKAGVTSQKALFSQSARPAQQRQQVAAACPDCGVIVEVKEVEVLGNQMRKHTRYDITVRTNDGTTRALSDESGTPIAFRAGDKVRVSKEGAISPI